MRTRPGICQRKKRFANEEEALRVAERAPFPLRPYRCELCGDFHLTGRTKRMKLPAFEIVRRRDATAARREDAET
ncbi:hypothetical protein FMM79_03030 [Novosphingobium sp. BW1]|nr:hypothetical protein [Novosphingobium sp. BW1]TYC92981.1 hypothetical protein FMM79_03030 [Novosphingobium sp. BW1]